MLTEAALILGQLYQFTQQLSAVITITSQGNSILKLVFSTDNLSFITELSLLMDVYQRLGNAFVDRYVDAIQSVEQALFISIGVVCKVLILTFLSQIT